MSDYITSDGDMIDAIVAAHYGIDEDFAALLATTLEANPHLVDHGPVLDAGLIVTLPTRPASTTTATVRLWGDA